MTEKLRYVLAGLIGLGLIVFIFVLIFRGFQSTSKPATPTQVVDITKYAATDAVAQLTIDGPIINDDAHRTAKIYVSRDSVRVDIIQGYQGDVIDSRTYPNNESAYAVFLRALALQGFTRALKTTDVNKDERGYCSQGYRYIYSFDNDGDQLVRSWNTTCGKQGTFLGVGPNVRWLFKKQIPAADYSKIFGNTGLN